MNNFEKIKAMSIDEMAIYLALYTDKIIKGVLQDFNIEVKNFPPLEFCIANQKQWLEHESEEE